MRSRPGLAFDKRRAATIATTSKYSHHMAPATTIPSTAATTTPASRTLTLGAAGADRDDRLAERDDDDRAVALGEVAGNELPAVGAEQEGSADVEHHRDAPDAQPRAPAANAAANSSPTPTAVLPASPTTERRSAASSRLASRNSAMCAPRTAA